MLQSQGLYQSGVRRELRRKNFLCNLIDSSTGLVCDIPFTRKLNLNCHKRDQHRPKLLIIIEYNPTEAQHTLAMATTAAKEAQLPRAQPLNLISETQQSEAVHSLAQASQARWRPAPTLPSSVLSSTLPQVDEAKPIYLAQPADRITPDSSHSEDKSEDQTSQSDAVEYGTSFGEAVEYGTPFEIDSKSRLK